MKRKMYVFILNLTFFHAFRMVSRGKCVTFAEIFNEIDFKITYITDK